MITSSLQDYLEIIYNKTRDGSVIKAIDIAREFNISRASVSEALYRLAQMGLINYEPRKNIDITKEGIKEASLVAKKHEILFNFFNQVLKVEEKSASDNACRIEHVIDQEIIEKIEKHTKEIKKEAYD